MVEATLVVAAEKEDVATDQDEGLATVDLFTG